MVGSVEGRPDKVVHTGIHDKEVLGLSALDEKHTGYKGGTLSHK